MHFKSCHPPGVKKSFIKEEALRLLRMNSSKETFGENINKFKQNLRLRATQKILSRKCSQKLNSLTGSQLSKKKQTIARKEILPFVTQYDPCVPNLKQILMVKGHLIESQPLLRQIYKEPPLIPYKGVNL